MPKSKLILEAVPFYGLLACLCGDDFLILCAGDNFCEYGVFFCIPKAPVFSNSSMTVKGLTSARDSYL